MVTPQLVEYIKKTLAQGYSEPKIVEALNKKGWSQGDISEAVRIAKGIPLSENKPVQKPLENAETAQKPVQLNTILPSDRSSEPIDRSGTDTPNLEKVAPVGEKSERKEVVIGDNLALNTQAGRLSNSDGLKDLKVQNQPMQTEKSAGNRKMVWLILGSGLLLIIGSYAYFGVKYGIYAFGMNLFPFETITEKFRTSDLPSPTPTILISASPTENPSPTPTQKPKDAIAEAYKATALGSDADAGTLTSLSFNKDGNKALYSLLSETANLWIIDLTSGTKSDLIKSGKIALSANSMPVSVSWSSVSNSIAFTIKTNEITNLFIADIDSTGALNVSRSDSKANSVNLTPKWSSDAQILLTCLGKDLWEIGSKGTERARITSGLQIGDFDWKGDKIAYSIIRENGERIWVMDKDGKNYKFVSGEGINRLPKIYENKAIFYVEKTAEGKENLWKTDIDGKDPIKFAAVEGQIRDFSISKNGQIALIYRNFKGEQALDLIGENGVDRKELIRGGEFEPLDYPFFNDDGSILFAGKNHFLIRLSK